jgi:hypothetical protein
MTNPRNLLQRLGGLRACSDAEVFACFHKMQDDPAADLSVFSAEAVAEAMKLAALVAEMRRASGGNC